MASYWKDSRGFPLGGFLEGFLLGGFSLVEDRVSRTRATRATSRVLAFLLNEDSYAATMPLFSTGYALQPPAYTASAR